MRFLLRNNLKLRISAGLMALLYAYLGLFVVLHHTHGTGRSASASQKIGVKTTASQVQIAAVSAPDKDCAACDFLASLLTSPRVAAPLPCIPPIVKIGYRPFAPRLPTSHTVCYSDSRAPPAAL